MCKSESGKGGRGGQGWRRLRGVWRRLGGTAAGRRVAWAGRCRFRCRAAEAGAVIFPCDCLYNAWTPTSPRVTRGVFRSSSP